MKTIRLFDENSHLYTFEATVLSVEAGKSPDTLNVVLFTEMVVFLAM